MRCVRLLYSALSNVYPGAHISCTVNRTMWDLSLPMPPLLVNEMWVCSFAASYPSPPPLPSPCSHPPCVGVVSGGGGVVGVPSTSEVAAYHARDTTATLAEGSVRCCTSPCASLCVLLCCVPRLSSLNTASSPRTDHHSPTRTTCNSCQP